MNIAQRGIRNGGNAAWDRAVRGGWWIVGKTPQMNFWLPFRVVYEKREAVKEMAKMSKESKRWRYRLVDGRRR